MDDVYLALFDKNFCQPEVIGAIVLSGLFRVRCRKVI